ncbi:MAG: hypothetical protein HY340_03465 [Candidatus Kerfeldbacteria bacterium]|nr:hypothetical protein [Candidatus Kerfeldbacteria bacterium]
MAKRTAADVLRDIREHPERHQHNDIDQLTRCCSIDNAVDLALWDAHEGIVDGPNRGCDVKSGPCACGAWH